MRATKLLPAPLAWLALAAAAAATTYYVRPDGGSAAQCRGTVDAPYPGSGTARPCAWNHPFQALPPHGTPRIAGGDVLVIGAGSYRMGFGAPGAEACDADGAFDCMMPAVPSGLDPEHPTRILGAGWESGCAAAPELWGAERPWYLLDLEGSSYVEIACLELTDHSPCVEFHCHGADPCPGASDPCKRDQPPFGDWAATGIFAQDSSHVRLADLHIHGLAENGVRAGGLRDWTVERVRIVANGWAGWEGDVGPAQSSNSGDLTFRELEVAWNGCGETWPGEEPHGCWAQQTGGYGDGFAAGSSGGHWLLEDCYVHHNTSDGVDLLYLTAGASVEIRRLVAVGNSGNQLKTAGSVEMENSLVVGNCAYFEDWPLMVEGDRCRAFGAAYDVDLHRGDQVRVVHSTITGEGDCLMAAGCNDSADPDPDCDGTESVLVRNTLFAGTTDWGQPWENACLFYWESSTLPADPQDFDWNLVWQVKNDACPGAHDLCDRDPRLTSGDVDAFDGRLLASSPAVDAANPAYAPATDLLGRPRPAGDGPDIGAYEHQAGEVGECTPGATAMCLNDGRFRVEVSWREFTGSTGAGKVVPGGGDDSGLFWFFAGDNWEMLVKVLDGCAVNDHYWVFAAATTNVEYNLRVTDTASGRASSYFNALGVSSPAITDTFAFATCP
ncbi:MAG: hypothetical protein GY856_06115 [bacterium]|nr:hypothetical protein [bacterium]